MASRHSRIRIFSVAFAALGLAACNGNHTPPGSGAFRLANGISDSGGLQASIASVPTVGPVAIDAASGIIAVPEGSYRVQLIPQAAGAAPFDVDGVGIGQDTLSTLFAYGSIGSSTQGGFAASESLAAPASGQVTMQAVVASASAPSGYLYYFTFMPVGSTRQANQIQASFGSPAATQTVALAAGKYEITVNAAPNCNPSQNSCPPVVEFLFDSGPQGVEIPGSNGANVFQLAMAAATSAQQSQYGALVTLLLLDNMGGSSLLLNGQQ